MHLYDENLKVNMFIIRETNESNYYVENSLGQKLFHLLVRLGYLNGKFTSPKKESLVQIINNLFGQFKL